MLILFKEDWAKYPKAILDLETKNKSAIELCYKLKHMGVENNMFPLALHDPSLLGVDPHSTDLTLQQKVAISVECSKNFFYVVRNVLRAPARSGPEPIEVLFNRANCAFWWLFFNHITVTLTQPRQTGKSFSANLLYTALIAFLCRGTRVNLLTKDDGLRTENLIAVRDIYGELPPYLNMRTPLDTSSTMGFEVGKLRNAFLGRVPSNSVAGANKVGRGLVTPVVGIDEPPFQPLIRIALPAIAGAMGAAIIAAKRANKPWGMVLTTTAGKIDEDSGEYMYNFVQDSAPMSEKFYDAQNAEDLDRMIKGYSRKGVARVYAAYNHRQLGYTDAWLVGELQRGNQTPDEANRDYLNVWTNGSANSPLDTRTLGIIAKSVVPDLCTRIYSTDKYIVRWYIKEEHIDSYMATHDTILSLDTSDAGGRDGIGFVITDTLTGAPIAVTALSLTNLWTFTMFILDLMVKWERMILVPERKNSAITLIDTLLIMLPQRGIDPVTRIFNWVINDPIEYRQYAEEFAKPLRRRDPEVLTRAKTLFGFATAATGRTSRSELYSTVLQSSMRRCGHLMRDRQLIDQITGLIVKNNRVDHKTDGHDDLVICVLLAHWFLTTAKNLINYGIDPTGVMIDNQEKAAPDPKKLIANLEQEQIRKSIDELFKRLKEEKDGFLAIRLESQMRALSSRMILQEGEVFSLDQMLTDLKQKKAMDRYRKQLVT
jgi:hypothetical protein